MAGHGNHRAEPQRMIPLPPTAQQAPPFHGYARVPVFSEPWSRVIAGALEWMHPNVGPYF